MKTIPEKSPILSPGVATCTVVRSDGLPAFGADYADVYDSTMLPIGQMTLTALRKGIERGEWVMTSERPLFPDMLVQWWKLVAELPCHTPSDGVIQEEEPLSSSGESSHVERSKGRKRKNPASLSEHDEEVFDGLPEEDAR